jgi:phage-related minor tail protein
MAEGDPVVVNVQVDASALRRELTEAERLSRSFGSALGDALEAGVVKGRSLGDVLRGLGARLSEIALSAALKPVENAFGSIFSSLTRGALGGVSPFGQAGLSTPSSLVSGGAGFAGVTPAPAVSAEGSHAPAPTPFAGPITVNISTPDAESFRRSEAQVTAALARAVARGRRGL